jgi:hypothetical protein
MWSFFGWLQLCPGTSFSTPSVLNTNSSCNLVLLSLTLFFSVSRNSLCSSTSLRRMVIIVLSRFLWGLSVVLRTYSFHSWPMGVGFVWRVVCEDASWTRRVRISSAIFLINIRVAGRPVAVRRVIHRANVFSAFERACSISWGIARAFSFQQHYR